MGYFFFFFFLSPAMISLRRPPTYRLCFSHTAVVARGKTCPRIFLCRDVYIQYSLHIIFSALGDIFATCGIRFLEERSMFSY